jgi:uncharacterized protein
VIVLDTSLIYTLADRADADHLEAVAWYLDHEPELVTTPLVLAEADYLIRRRLGQRAQSGFWADVAAGAYLVDWWVSAPKQIAEIAEHRSELDLGLTDASLVALADRYETLDIATLDHRHFRAVRSVGDGEPFRLLPADA